MRPSPLPVLLAAAVLALAGCLGPAAPADDPGEPAQPTAEGGEPLSGQEPPVLQPVREADDGTGGRAVFPFTGHVTVGLGAKGAGYLSPTGSSDPHIHDFHVDVGAVAVLAELRWATGAMDLDLELAPPDCDTTTAEGCLWADGGTPGAPDSPVQLWLTDPAKLAQPGAWKVFVWGKNAVNTDYEAVVTVFYGVGADDGYTGFAP